MPPGQTTISAFITLRGLMHGFHLKVITGENSDSRTGSISRTGRLSHTGGYKRAAYGPESEPLTVPRSEPLTGPLSESLTLYREGLEIFFRKQKENRKEK
jgi:hypothetical protein